MRTWLKNPLSKWFLFILIAALGYGAHRVYKELTMPPPLVFLIPEEYFGPVFFFFDQPDGVDVKPDPLGQAVWVPENGVVKLKAPAAKLVGESSEGHRATYMVSVSPEGTRKILKVSFGPRQEEDGSWFAGYFDENTKLHKFPFNKDTEERPTVFLFPESTRNERMVFNHDGCIHQEFIPDNNPNAKSPACGKFLLISPNEFLNLPPWMWRNLQHAYSSVQEFVDEANERVKKKKEYYHLSPQEPHSISSANTVLRVRAGEPCPRSGVWQSQDAKAVQRTYREGEIMADLHSAYGATVWQWVK